MASQTIFVAYSHKDRFWEEKVESHLGVLRHTLPGIDVWDDRRIGAGANWLREIEQAIARARVAILLVSDRFLTSDFITRKEVPEILRKRASDGLIVIPVVVRACAWKAVPWLKVLNARPANGKALAGLRHKVDEALAGIATEIAAVFSPDGGSSSGVSTLPTPSVASDDVRALNYFPVGGTLPLPCFFPSVSGAAKSALSPLDHLRVLVSFEFPCFLASAYDFATAKRSDRLEMGALVAEAKENGRIVLLDSGLYEKKWLRDSKWSRPRFLSTLASIPCDLSFSYDSMKDRPGPTAAAEIVAQVLGDRRKTDLDTVFPIIHGKPEDLPQLAKEVATLLDSSIVAVPERELGDGVLAGAKTMLALRRALNETGRYRVVHVLGTGNPLSLLIYSACGADSFDGLDWCQTVADHKGKRLYHGQQLDFFAEQSRYASDPALGYSTRLLAHNLEFFRYWMGEIQRHRVEDRMKDLACEVLPEAFRESLMAVLARENGAQ